MLLAAVLLFIPLQGAPAQKKSPAPQAAQKQVSPSDELQQTIEAAGNDRAALVRNLESFLQKYPQAAERPEIFRALVEASLQLNDTPKAAAYAERLVSLKPEDMSITLLAIQLLEKTGDDAALGRAKNYSSRVLEYVRNSGDEEKSPRVSPEEWTAEKKRDESSLLMLRARLETKLRDNPAARKDAAESYAILPNAAAAEKLGELDELNKNYASAISNYARAFSMTDPAAKLERRRELRQKLGNVWRLAHGGSEVGLGEYLLASFDEISATRVSAKMPRNSAAKGPFEYTLRKAPAGSDFPLAVQKGKVTVVNFWATWCGPCRALEPLYEKAAAEFSGDPSVLFLSADCDDDESLVGPYLEEVKPRTAAVFADGLDKLFRVEAFPTVIVLDRTGKVSFRSDGFGDPAFVEELSAAVRHALADSNAVAKTQ